METYKMMVCMKHGYTQFSLRKDGRYRCSKCSTDSVNERRRNLKKQLVEYKGGKCEICGYNECIGALEFHHKDPNKKDFGISNGNIRSLKDLKKEILT